MVYLVVRNNAFTLVRASEAEKSELKIFENKQIRTLWDKEQEEWYFSVVDVVAVLTDSVDPKQYIKKCELATPNWRTSGVQFVPLLKCLG